MIRWGVKGLMVVLGTAVVLYFTPAAFAGCEGGDATGGHNAIAFCCGDGNGRGDGGADHGGKGGGKSKDAHMISGHSAR